MSRSNLPYLRYKMRSTLNGRIWIGVLAVILSVNVAKAADILWNNAGGDNIFSNAANWEGGVVPAGKGNNAIINSEGEDRAIFTADSNVSFDGIYVGRAGTGVFDIAGGDLLVTANTNRVTSVGHTGGIGTVNHSAGRFRVNALQVGTDHEGSGAYILSGGELEVRRTYANASLLVGNKGVGRFEVSGGILTTRLGLHLGVGDGVGEFYVVGSGATQIGIGSSTVSDGDWVQGAFGTLKVAIDDGGLTPIFVDDIENDGVGGDVSFADGAKLDVGFLGTPLEGSWTVMTCEGVMTNNGLSIQSEDVIAGWSFSIEDTGVNGDCEGPDTLVVTYAEPNEDERIIKGDGESLVLKVESGVVSLDDVAIAGPLKGSVLFATGSVLDIDFVDTPVEGDFLAFQWEGILVDDGVVLSSEDIEGGWGMHFEDQGINGDIAGPDTLILSYSEPGVDFEIPSEIPLVVDLDFGDFGTFKVGDIDGTHFFTGDALFGEGSQIEIDVDGDVRNGSWTLLNWKGVLSDGGLMLSPERMENGWSLVYEDNGTNVEGMDTLILTYATPMVKMGRFTHPGIYHKKSDLARMRAGIAAGQQPWASSYAKLAADSFSSSSYAVQGDPTFTSVSREGSSTVNKGPYESDMTAAYQNALMYHLNGNQRHADKAIEILNTWSNLNSIIGTPLNVGLYGERLIAAAELIKHSNAGWKEEDVAKFSAMLVYPGYSNTVAPLADIGANNKTFYWGCYNGDSKRAGNQELSAWRTVIAIGIFLDSEIIYDRALRYVRGQAHRSDDLPYESGPSNPTTLISAGEHQDSYNFENLDDIPDWGFDGVLTNYIFDNGQSAESSRDQTHAMFGVSLLTQISEIAWNQGDDLYSWSDNRILVGLDYHLKYNVSYENSYPDQLEPWEPDPEQGEFYQIFGRTGRTKFLKINPYNGTNQDRILRGVNITRPYWEMPLNHYIHRTKIDPEDYKWVQRARDVNLAKTGSYEVRSDSRTDHPGWGALAYVRPDLCSGDPVRGFDGALPLFEMNAVPGTLLAVNYDSFTGDGEDFTYHDTTSANEGGEYRDDAVDISSDPIEGYVLSDLSDGEWLNYTVNVAEAGDYDLLVRYKAASSGGAIRFEIGGEALTTDIALASTSGQWLDSILVEDVSLQVGVQALRVFIGGSSGSFELSNIQVTRLTQFDAWKLEKGISVAISDDADFDGNGISVLMEYSMGIEPGASSDFPSWKRNDDGTWSYSYKPARSELSYDVFVGDSLPYGPWTLLAEGETIEGEIATLVYSPEVDTDEVYFRLRVTEPTVGDAKEVTGLAVEPSRLELAVDERLELSAIVSPSDAEVPALAWTSDDNSVAIVWLTGIVIGKAAGTTTIRVFDEFGVHVGSCEVVVSP